VITCNVLSRERGGADPTWGTRPATLFVTEVKKKGRKAKEWKGRGDGEQFLTRISGSLERELPRNTQKKKQGNGKKFTSSYQWLRKEMESGHKKNLNYRSRLRGSFYEQEKGSQKELGPASVSGFITSAGFLCENGSPGEASYERYQGKDKVKSFALTMEQREKADKNQKTPARVDHVQSSNTPEYWGRLNHRCKGKLHQRRKRRLLPRGGKRRKRENPCGLNLRLRGKGYASKRQYEKKLSNRAWEESRKKTTELRQRLGLP